MGTTGLLVGTDGTLAAVTVAQANGSHLASMYAHIGCRTVDVISVSTNAGTLDVWVDDEGAFTAAQNVIMSAVLTALTGHSALTFGNALILTSNDEGETLSLTAEQRHLITEVHKVAQAIPGVQDEIEAATLDAILTGRY
ncbi:DUF3846 domain-containing protein [Dietzia cinnamea]|uniref:DUF3846 domain-containing protein n=1 Tax=Dietzia cinnamea TaxID=321318 RepID=UPI0021A6CE22|nr:DUF3846 domain-containing protein [Dietzia cinnamea]MCT2031839.1 DUF3846 domain-containing protein [Dietzia cinnamea]